MTGTPPPFGERIRAVRPPEGSLALFWLGQAGFALHGHDTTLLIDPYLVNSPQRLVPPVADPSEFTGVDAVFATHQHIDHLDLPTWPALAAASPAARFVVPAPIVDQVIGAGIPANRVIGAQPEIPLRFGAATVTPVPARHGVHVADAYNFGKEISGGLVRYLGYVVDLNGVHLYHSGDTIMYDGMVERLRALGVTLALLPINGRDWRREQHDIVGNLSYREAADLAAELGLDAVAPMHYDMFYGNTQNPGALTDYVHAMYPALTTITPGRGAAFVYTHPQGGSGHGG